MSSKEFVYYTQDLCKEVGGANEAAICSKVWYFCGEQNTPTPIHLSWLCDMLCIKERTLKKYIKKLVLLGMIEYTARYGKGLAPLFKRGQNLYPYFDEKGTKNALKRVQEMQGKEYNKNIIDGLDNAHAHAHISNPKPINQKEKKVMEQFEKFWQTFFSRTYKKHEEGQMQYKERAAAVWAQMSETARRSCLCQLQSGKRYDKTSYVLWYIKNYQEPLPIWYNGDDDLTPQMVSQMVVLRYKTKIAYCYPKDLERVLKAGAERIVTS